MKNMSQTPIPETTTHIPQPLTKEHLLALQTPEALQDLALTLRYLQEKVHYDPYNPAILTLRRILSEPTVQVTITGPSPYAEITAARIRSEFPGSRGETLTPGTTFQGTIPFPHTPSSLE